MSDKLTEEKIEQLILELLQERTVGIVNKNSNKDLADTTVYKRVYGQNTLPTNYPNYKKLKQIAAQDKDKKNLDSKDYTLAKTKATNAQSGTLYGYDDSQFDTLLSDFENQSVSGLGGAKKSTSKKKTFKTQSGDIDTTGAIKAKARTPVATGGGLDLDYSAASEASSYISGGKLKAAGAIDPGTIKIVQAEMTKYKSLDGMFTHYATLADNIKKAAGGNATAQTAIASIDAEDLFTSMEVLATLANVSNKFQGASAGAIFETVLALIGGGIVVGGSGGANDVLMGKKGELQISAKNYSVGPAATITGATQAATNIHNMTKGEVIWYIGFGKVGGKGKITTLKIFIIGIERTGTKDNPSSFRWIKADGSKHKSAKVNKDGRYMIRFTNPADYSISIGKLQGAQLIDFDALASAAIQKANDATQKAIQGIYDKLEKLRSNTQEFLASMKSNDTTNASTLATSSGTMYKGLKTDFQTGYGGVQTGAGAQFQESKLESLDDLIAETLRDIKKKRKK